MPVGCGCFSRSSVRAASPSARASSNDGNRVMVPALNRLVSFHATKHGAKSETGDNIKYNINDAEIEKFCVKSASKESLHSKGKTLLERPSLSQKEEQKSLPAYVDGEEIEYYSHSYQRWLHGVVQCTQASETGCTIVLSQGGQVRQNVGLDLLRSPLRAHELVELFSGRQGGTRIAAVIAESQLSPSSLLGNRVKVEGSSDVLDSIPSLRLKRRYLRNQEIEVYRGAKRGWQSAKVHHTAIQDGCGAEVCFLSGVEQACAGVNARQTVISPSLAMEKVKSDGHEFSPSDIGLWSLVPVCRDAGREDATPESIPSYLIRAVRRTS